MKTELDEWNKVKKKLNFSEHNPPFFKEGDIWLLSVGYNIGYEIYGKGKDFGRPVLIIKKFNPYFFIGIPLSTKLKKENKYYVEITFKKKNVSALTSQIRAFSSKRLIYKMLDLDEKDYTKILKNVEEFLLPPSIARGSRG